MKANYHEDFIEEKIYHVYNRTNNKELLFRTDENRVFFLNKFDRYLSPFFHTFCRNLLPNHFHYLVKVKSAEAIKAYLNNLPVRELVKIEKQYLEDNTSAELLLEAEWKRFFISYSMSFNNQYDRKGNLFHRPFKRKLVDTDDYFTQLVIYIHANAQHHNMCENFTEYPWSSWHEVVSSIPTNLERKMLFDWFGGIDRFKQAHYNHNKICLDHVYLEDD